MLTVLVCPFICNNLHVISAVFEQFIFFDQNCHLQFSFTENLTLITQVITEGYRVGSGGGGGGQEGVRTILKAKMFSLQCCALHYFQGIDG